MGKGHIRFCPKPPECEADKGQGPGQIGGGGLDALWLLSSSLEAALAGSKAFPWFECTTVVEIFSLVLLFLSDFSSMYRSVCQGFK